MLPWNYGFHWNVGHVVFLGAFYIVLLIVSVTLIAALRRSRRALLEHRVEQISWAADFHDLPSADRICRHELTGELDHRQCPNAFDCRRCATHAMLLQRRPAPEAVAPEAEIFGNVADEVGQLERDAEIDGMGSKRFPRNGLIGAPEDR